MAESEEELKSLLMKVKVKSEKVGLKLMHPLFYLITTPSSLADKISRGLSSTDELT